MTDFAFFACSSFPAIILHLPRVSDVKISLAVIEYETGFFCPPADLIDNDEHPQYSITIRIVINPHFEFP